MKKLAACNTLERAARRLAWTGNVSPQDAFGWESLPFGKIPTLQTVFYQRPVGTGQPLMVAAIMGF